MLHKDMIARVQFKKKKKERNRRQIVSFKRLGAKTS
jgi:hypothetical protein